jgi:hypothetical protein
MINHILIFINGRGLVSKSISKFTVITQYLKMLLSNFVVWNWVEIGIKILGIWDLGLGIKNLGLGDQTPTEI